MKVDSEGVSWFGRPPMQPVLSILREVRDPRAPNARHELSAILFIALAATLCGQKSCVHIADFGAVNAAELAEIVELPHGAPSHDCFSRVFRLLDPAELAKALASLRVGFGCSGRCAPACALAMGVRASSFAFWPREGGRDELSG